MSASIERLEARQLLASIAGNLFNDVNNNSVKNVGEANLSGRTVYIDLNDNKKLDAAEPKATTNAGGNYKISNLAARKHLVRQVLPSGWEQTTPTGGLAIHVIVSAHQNVMGKNFGARQNAKGSINGTVFNDVNANGVKDADEAALSGRTVYIDRDNDRVRDASEPKATTDAGGKYKISNLAAGHYVVRQVLPAGWAQTTPPGGLAIQVGLGGGQNRTGKDFGARDKSVPILGSISGTVFEDRNSNAFQDFEEPLLANTVVYLDANNDNIHNPGETSVLTDGDGLYRFSNLSAGDKHVRAELPIGWMQTYPSEERIATLAPGEGLVGLDFGIRQITGSISGTVFDDGNANGIQDPGEEGVPGQTIYFDLNDDGIRDHDTETFEVTELDGVYRFNDVYAGDKRWRVDLGPSGSLPNVWAQTLPAGARTATLAFGEELTDQNFGIRLISPEAAASISGTLFEDVNGNGTKDTGEGGLLFRHVYLDLDNDQTFDDFDEEPDVRTDADGNYRFRGLAAGTYMVRHVPLSGFTQISPIGGSGISVTVAQRENAIGKDFAIQRKTPADRTISGKVFNDLDLDGILDPGETGLAGLRVYLNLDREFFNNDQFSTSDSSGNYTFTGLTHDSYRVQVDAFPGYKSTSPFALEISVIDGDAIDQNFGLVSGYIRGQLWVDSNNDDINDPAEPGLSGWTVFIDSDKDGLLDAGEQSTVTDGDGLYRFILPAGGTAALRVRPVQQAGYTLLAPTLGYRDVPAVGFIRGYAASNVNFRYTT